MKTELRKRIVAALQRASCPNPGARTAEFACSHSASRSEPRRQPAFARTWLSALLFRMGNTPQSGALAVTLNLITLGTALAQPVPTTFTRITTGAIATDRGESWSAAWGDHNNDGFEDLFVARNLGQNDRLYLNNGNGTFASILVGDVVNDGTDSAAGVWGDYDNDGYLDLVVTVNTFPTARPSLLYHNEGDGTFAKVTSGSIATNINLGMKGCSWGDYDNDGYIDLFVANDGYTDSAQRKDFLYRNDGAGGFTRILSGPVVNDSGQGEQGAWGDYNNDGKLDLFVANINSLGHYCPVIEKAIMPKIPVVIDDYRSLDLLTI